MELEESFSSGNYPNNYDTDEEMCWKYEAKDGHVSQTETYLRKWGLVGNKECRTLSKEVSVL